MTTNNFPRQIRWPRDRAQLHLGPVTITNEDCHRHIFVTGGSGSGKTSAVLPTVLRPMLRDDWGVLFLCTKPDDRAMVLQWLEETGRLADARILGLGQLRFDPLRYMIKHSNIAVNHLASIVSCVESMLAPALENSGRGGSSDDAFWATARHALIRHLLAIAIASGHEVTFDLLDRMLKSTPQNPEALLEGGWKQGVFGQCLAQAQWRTATPGIPGTPGSSGTHLAREVQLARAYFLQEAPFHPDRTKACVTMAVEGIFYHFRDPLVESLTSAVEVQPEDALDGGKVVIIDLPDNVAGRMLTQAFKHLYMQVSLLRSVPPGQAESLRPSCLVIDEYQSKLSPQDPVFLARARSARVSCVFLTQSIPGLVMAMGSSPTPREAVDALLTNFGLKLMLNNSDAATTQWCSAQLGRSLQFHLSTQTAPPTLQSTLPFFNQPTYSVSQQWEDDMPASEFVRLKTGGAQHQYEVEAIALIGPKAVQATGKPWLRVTFDQRSPGASPESADASVLGRLCRWLGRGV